MNAKSVVILIQLIPWSLSSVDQLYWMTIDNAPTISNWYSYFHIVCHQIMHIVQEGNQTDSLCGHQITIRDLIIAVIIIIIRQIMSIRPSGPYKQRKKVKNQPPVIQIWTVNGSAFSIFYFPQLIWITPGLISLLSAINRRQLWWGV